MRDAVLERGKDGKGDRFTTLEWKRRLETFGPGDTPVIATGPGGELDGVCDMGASQEHPSLLSSFAVHTDMSEGMLTDVGRLSTLALGERLRTLYVHQLNFLPSTISSADFIYLRATPVPRALESLQQSFAGLYPIHTRTGNFPPPTILVRTMADETLFPNDSTCRRFAALSQAFGQRTAQRWNASEEMAYLSKIYGKWMPEGNGGKVAVDAKPRLSGIMDTVNSTLAHGPETRLPKEFYDPKAREILERIGTEEWFSGYKESNEYRKLGIGALLGDVTARMIGSVEHSPADGEYELMRTSGQNHTAVKFGMSGCHDTTLAGCLASLGAFNTDRWPPFTSHIAFELFRDTAKTTALRAQDQALVTPAPPKMSWFSSIISRGSGPTTAGKPPASLGRKPTDELKEDERQKLEGYYVRIRYNDEAVTIPGCKPLGNHLEGDETFCTLVCFILQTMDFGHIFIALGSHIYICLAYIQFHRANNVSKATFKSIVDKFTPRDWKQECKPNKNAPIFPNKPEAAGY